MDVIPLDASLVKGSHGLAVPDPPRRWVFIGLASVPDKEIVLADRDSAIASRGRGADTLNRSSATDEIRRLIEWGQHQFGCRFVSFRLRGVEETENVWWPRPGRRWSTLEWLKNGKCSRRVAAMVARAAGRWRPWRYGRRPWPARPTVQPCSPPASTTAPPYRSGKAGGLIDGKRGLAAKVEELHLGTAERSPVQEMRKAWPGREGRAVRSRVTHVSHGVHHVERAKAMTSTMPDATGDDLLKQAL